MFIDEPFSIYHTLIKFLYRSQPMKTSAHLWLLNYNSNFPNQSTAPFDRQEIVYYRFPILIQTSSKG